MNKAFAWDNSFTSILDAIAKLENEKLRDDLLKRFNIVVDEINYHTNDTDANNALLKDYLAFLENIHIKTFFSSTPLGDMLGKNMPRLSEPAKNPSITIKLNPKDIDSLKNIYIQVRNQLPKWKAEYQWNIPKEQIWNKPIERYQGEHEELYANNASFHDFNRDIGIENKSGEIFRDEKVLEQALNDFVQKAIGNGGYAASEKDNLYRWLANNGGQHTSRFIEKLFIHDAFSASIIPKEDAKNLRPDFVKRNTANWNIAENGKINYNYNIDIYIISNGILESYVKLGGKIQKINDPETLANLKKEGKLEPIMNIDTTVELRPHPDSPSKVRPCVTKLVVTAYDDSFVHQPQGTKLLPTVATQPTLTR